MSRNRLCFLLALVIIAFSLSILFKLVGFQWLENRSLGIETNSVFLRRGPKGYDYDDDDEEEKCDECDEESHHQNDHQHPNRRENNKVMIDNWRSVEKLELNDKVLKTRKWFRKGCPPSPSVQLSPKSLSMVVRKEYRTLSKKERQRFHDCLLMMIKTPAVEPFWDQSEYDSFVTQHRFQFSPQAHGSAAFAPYHRVYLFYFERVLRSHEGCEEVGLPYWDTTLDSFLPDPSMSAMFTDDSFIGNSKGEITKGFLANNWTTVKIPMCVPYGKKLARAMCSDRFQMMTDSMIDEFINCPNFEQCVSPQSTSFEENHGLIHGCLGGHMKELICSPYDPLFYMHHSFVDLIFDHYLAKAFPSYDLDASVAYPVDEKIDVYYQRGSEPMRPFEGSGLKVKDGMSRNFTRDLYTYQPRPHHCTKASHCQSKLLWCDTEAQRCKAKAGEDGECTDLPNEACYCKYPEEKPFCSTITSKCECLGGTGQRKTLPAVKSCSGDTDCQTDEWCRQRSCERKMVLGEECGNLPDNACSPNTSVELTGDKSLVPCRHFENVRCLKGRCSCFLPMIRCDFSNTDCHSIDPELWCHPKSSLCLYRGRPGDQCDRKNPHAACGHCVSGEFGLCSKKSKRCICLSYDDVAEAF